MPVGDYNYGTGRRKNSIARVFVKTGTGSISLNGQSPDDYFDHREPLVKMVMQPLEAVERTGQFDIKATLKGGGKSGQAGAFRHGLARALCEANPELRDALKKAGYLRRDPRMVERKKYGQRGARARFQFSKR